MTTLEILTEDAAAVLGTVALAAGGTTTLGRVELRCDHDKRVSRKHIEVELAADGTVRVTRLAANSVLLQGPSSVPDALVRHVATPWPAKSTLWLGENPTSHTLQH